MSRNGTFLWLTGTGIPVDCFKSVSELLIALIVCINFHLFAKKVGQLGIDSSLTFDHS